MLAPPVQGPHNGSCTPLVVLNVKHLRCGARRPRQLTCVGEMTKACSPVTPRRSPRLSGAAHDDEPPTTVLALLLACGDRAALHAVLACLSAQCLATARCVCAKLNVAGAAHDLWASHCLADWADKVHVAPSARSQLEVRAVRSFLPGLVFLDTLLTRVLAVLSASRKVAARQLLRPRAPTLSAPCSPMRSS